MKALLGWDTCNSVIDRYILAIAFIYLKKANLTSTASADVVYLLSAM